MSGRLIFCAVLLTINAVVSVAHAAQQSCTTLIAVIQLNAEPYDWLTPEANVQQGLSVDFLQALAEKTQLSIGSVAVKTAEKALREVRSGRVDLIVGAHAQPEQDPRLDYLYPAYAQQEYRLWVRAGEQLSLKQWPELSGLRGVRVLESKLFADFDRQAQLFAWPIRSVKNNQQATQMVLKGQADYVLAEQHQQQLYLQTINQLELFEVVEQPIVTDELFVALAKDSACNDQSMRSKLSKALLELTQPDLSKNRLNVALQRWQAAHPRASSVTDE